MFDPSVAALFPLPLTTFEKYMFLDDRPDYPMAFVIQLKLSGEMRRGVFESSFEEALSHHPLLCALVKRSARNGLVWTLAQRPRPTIDWDSLGAAVGSPCGERIDLSSQTGLRVWVRQGDGAADVTLQFHHSCCDGGGALRFVGHLLAVYGMRTAPADRRPTLHPCDPTCLVRRGRFMPPPAPPVRGSPIRGVLAGVRDGLRWFSRRPTPLCPSAADAPETAAAPLPFLGIYRHRFDQSEQRRIHQTAARQDVTVNDLLLCDLFQTLREWNAGQASEEADRWLRIAVPVKLKTGDDDRMSAANGVSYTFLTRRESQCADPHALLRGIHRENDVVTRCRRGLMFLRGFRFMELIPGAIPLWSGADRCFATAVLSNLGDMGRLFRAQFPCESEKIVAGDLVLEDIFGTPPIRANTRAAFAAGTYGGRLWVSVQCDPRALTAADAHRLLSLYVDRLKGTMAEPEGSGVRGQGWKSESDP